MHPTCILPAKLNNIPVRLLNTMEPNAPGTLIYNQTEQGKIKAVAAKDGITAIKIKSGRMLLAYGFLRKVFEIFESYQTSIDMVTTSEVGVSVTIDNTKHLTEILDDLKKFGTVTVDEDMVIICVVGDLEFLRGTFAREDASRAVHTGLCNLYHGCVHNYLHERDEALLAALYKSAAFTLRAIAYLQTGRYESRMEPLAALLQPEERRILTCSQELRGGKGELPAPDFRRYSDVLLSWAAGWIARRGGGEGSQ